MKKTKLFKSILSLTSIAAIALIALAPNNLFAEGCNVVPGDKKGWCEKSVEGYSMCMPSFFKDCTSSGSRDAIV
jgi:hypothetical protein